MTQEHEQHQDDVRRLLRAAAQPPPGMPTHVSARLDEVIAGLSGERSGPADGESVVTPLRRERARRPRWPQVLVAAAAVSVLGLGIGNLAGQQAGQSESASGGDAALESVPEDAAEPAPEPGAAADTDEQSRESADAVPDVTLNGHAIGPEVRLRTRSLTVDVQRVEDFGLAAAVADGWEGACLRPDVPSASSWLPVRLDGAPAVLVLQPPSDGVRRAEVYTCDDAATPAATTTVDAR